MSISLPRILLPLLFALAFVVRWEPTRTLRLAPDEREHGTSHWLLDDPETCQEMRRIELAIASDKVVEFDRFVNFPAGGEIPALPLFDSLVAGTAQRLLRSPSGEAALGYVDEAELEDFVVKLAPILGLLAVLATYFAARTIATGPRGDIAALFAAALVAFHPATIAVSSAGTLDSAALSVIFLALLVRSVVRSIRGTTMPTSLLDALIAGALSGLLVSTSVLGFVLFVPAWIAFFVHALRSTGEARANAVRSGLFFSVVAAFLARMTLSEGPWEQGAGVVHGFVSGVSMLLLISAAPFVVLILLNRGATQRVFRNVCFVGALLVMAWQLPQVWRDLAPAVRWFLDNHAEITLAMPGVGGMLGADLPSLALAGVVILIVLTLALVPVLWRQRKDTATLALLAFVIALFGASIVTGLALSSAIVAAGCLAARFLDGGLAHENPRSARRTALGAGAFAAVALLIGLSPSLAKPDAVLREERIDFVAGLRWMRAHTENGGAWNSPRSSSAWGVLSSVATGPLVQYHARRPALLSPWSALSGPGSMSEALTRMWSQGELSMVEHFMRGQGARYVVLGGRWDRTSRDMFAAREDDQRPPAIARLTHAARSPVANALPGFALDYASKRRVDREGRTVIDTGEGLPVVAIWRLIDTASEMHEAELRPR